MRRIAIATLLLVALAGCSKKSERPAASTGVPGADPAEAVAPRPPAGTNAAEAHATEPTTAARGAPLVVRVEGPDTVSAGEVITLHVEITRQRQGGEPAQLTVHLPEGVTLLEGLEEEEIPATQLEVRQLRLRIATVPQVPLRVVAQIEGKGHGATATGDYRWGHAEAKLPEPKTTEVRAGGKKITDAVQLN